MNPFYRLNNFFFQRKKEIYDKTSKKKILSLLPELEDFMRINNAIGAGYGDYLELYNYIITKKPNYILECGGGISTFVIAKALEKISFNTSETYLVVTMEEILEFHEQLKHNFPDDLKKFVNFVHSERVEKKYMFYCGVGYKNIPKYEYEFIFIDGPDHFSPVDNIKKFNFDLISAIQISSKSINGIIDTRLGTSYCYQNIFGREKIKYDPIKKLGLIHNVSKKDLILNWEKKNFNLSKGNIDFKLNN